MPDLASLPGLGEKSVQPLHRIGLYTESDLREMGAVAAFYQCQLAGERPSLNMLYAMVGALNRQPWQQVASQQKEALLQQLESLKLRHGR